MTAQKKKKLGKARSRYRNDLKENKQKKTGKE
jgi:hypothetical protein